MAKVLKFTAEQWNDRNFDYFDIIDAMVWEDETDDHRWESYHFGVFEWEGAHYWAEWVTGLTEMQENRWFEDYMDADGGITFLEAESFDVTITKWRVKK